MNAKDIGGALGIVLLSLAIIFAIWITKSGLALWAILLIAVFGVNFPWSKRRAAKKVVNEKQLFEDNEEKSS